MEETLKSLKKPVLIVIWTGDFNFVFIEREKLRQITDVDLDMKISIESADKRQQLKRVMNTCESFNLVQVDHTPKRGNNILLFFTNEMVLFIDTNVNVTNISHHNIMEITTAYF